MIALFDTYPSPSPPFCTKDWTPFGPESRHYHSKENACAFLSAAFKDLPRAAVVASDSDGNGTS